MVTVATDGNGKRSHINWNCSARAGSSDRCRLTHWSTYVSDAQSWWSHRCILPSRTGRGASRLRRGAPNVWGFGGHLGAPIAKPEGTPEERPGFAGALRTSGGLGAISGPPSPTGMDLGEVAGHPFHRGAGEHECAAGSPEVRSAAPRVRR